MRVIDTFRTVLSLAYSPCGRFLYSAGWQHVSRWDVSNGVEKPLRQKGCNGYCRSVVVSPDGKQIAWLAQPSATGHWEVRVGHVGRSVQTATQQCPRSVHVFGPNPIGFLRGGQVVTHTDQLVASSDGIRLAARHGTFVRVARVQPAKVQTRSDSSLRNLKLVDMVEVRDATAFGFASADLFWWADRTTVTIRNMLTGEVIRSPASQVNPVALTPNGRTGIATNQRELILLDIPTGLVRERFNWDVGTVEAVAVAPDGLTVAVTGWSGGIAIFDLDR